VPTLTIDPKGANRLSHTCSLGKRLQMPLKLFQIVKDLFTDLNLPCSKYLRRQAFGFLTRAGHCNNVSVSRQQSESYFLKIHSEMETIGIEPTTSALQGRRSPS
jgi:hypothetical protein